jgi:hypothetical protein
MKTQNFKNHTQYVPGFHGFTFLAIVALLGGAIQDLATASHENKYSASLLVLVAVIFGCMFWYTRSFATKVQDRAIRAEENLRYFVLTGKPLDKNLSISQIIALRFASDEEFVALAAKAVAENLSAKQIKQAIVNWKPDYDRA